MNQEITKTELPQTLPLFPLPGVLLLPRGQLPLNIFEPRYLNMINDCLTSNRLIGMALPDEQKKGILPPPLLPVACAGKITAFAETDDGRFLVTLTGVARFRITGEKETSRGYRVANCDWSPFSGDLEHRITQVDRPKLLKVLASYVKTGDLAAEWKTIERMETEQLINVLAMNLPMNNVQKKALLEAKDLYTRAEPLTAMMELTTLSSDTTRKSLH